MVTHNRFWLLAPFWLWLAVDVGMTLAGQSDAYWTGDFAAALEGNPLAYPIVAQGPWVFGAFAVIWGAILGLSVYCVTHRFANWSVMLLAVANAVGGASWLTRFGIGGWFLALVYLFVAAEVSWWCWRRSGWPVRCGSSSM